MSTVGVIHKGMLDAKAKEIGLESLKLTILLL